MEDCLKVLPANYLQSLINYMESSLSQTSIWGRHYIYNHLKNLKIRDTLNNVSDACLTTIYGPKNGKFENCTFIGISDPNDYSVFLFTMEDSASELIECVKCTKKIDWHRRSFYIYMQSRYYSKIDEILKKKGIKQKKHIEHVYYLPKNDAKNFIINIPKEVFLKPLTLEEANVVNNSWPYKYKKSLQLIESAIQMNGGTGMYRTDNGELIAWTVTNMYFCPGFLHVIESERRKGYGILLFKAECKCIAENYPWDICVVVAQGNIASQNMIEKCGFQYAFELICVDLLS